MKTVAQMLHAKSSQDVHTITPEATVLDALWLMAECNVGALPVCDEQGGWSASSASVITPAKACCWGAPRSAPRSARS